MCVGGMTSISPLPHGHGALPRVTPLPPPPPLACQDICRGHCVVWRYFKGGGNLRIGPSLSHLSSVQSHAATPDFFIFICIFFIFLLGANSETGESVSGQLEHFVFVALPGIDPTLGFYSRYKYQRLIWSK